MPESTGSVERVDTPFKTMEMAFCSSVRLMLNFKASSSLAIHPSAQRQRGGEYLSEYRSL